MSRVFQRNTIQLVSKHVCLYSHFHSRNQYSCICDLICMCTSPNMCALNKTLKTHLHMWGTFVLKQHESLLLSHRDLTQVPPETEHTLQDRSPQWSSSAVPQDDKHSVKNMQSHYIVHNWISQPHCVETAKHTTDNPSPLYPQHMPLLWGLAIYIIYREEDTVFSSEEYKQMPFLCSSCLIREWRGLWEFETYSSIIHN